MIGDDQGRGRRRRILIIDDHAELKRTLQDILSVENDVVSAADGRAAMELIKTGPFDMLITDIGLPDMEGWELVKEASRHWPNIKSIVISSWKGEGIEAKIRELNVAEVIAKPFFISELRRAIERHCPCLSPVETREAKGIDNPE